MNKVRLTKEFRFEAAHSLEGYDGACSQIHGHSYRLLVTVEGEPLDSPGEPKDGMVMDFGVLKGIVNREIVDRLDHSFTIRRTAGNTALIEMLQQHYTNIHVVNWQPTSENMLHDMAARLKPALPPNINLVALKLYETATSSAELVL